MTVTMVHWICGHVTEYRDGERVPRCCPVCSTEGAKRLTFSVVPIYMEEPVR